MLAGPQSELLSRHSMAGSRRLSADVRHPLVGAYIHLALTADISDRMLTFSMRTIYGEAGNGDGIEAGREEQYAMSMARYLWSAAEALRLQVRPAVEGNNALGVLDNSIRVLTAVANALEPAGVAAIPSQFGDDYDADTDRLEGPAENLAAYRRTGHALARLAQDAAAPSKLGDAGTRAAIAWEKEMLDAGVARFDAIERAAAKDTDESISGIDPEALEHYLRDWKGSSSLRVENFRQVVGGRSRQTALFEIAGAANLPKALVVQRGIPGLAGGAGFLPESAQFSLLNGLHAAGMRVPLPLLVEEGESHLGAPFLIVERSSGSPALTDYWLTVESEELVFDLAREMALLHAQPLNLLGAKLAQSRGAPDASRRRVELDQLAADWDEHARWPSITMSAAIAWMRSNLDCLDDRPCIVHNDMVFHNILAENGRISAVLDWEQASIGHPGEDLGYCYPYVAAVTDWTRFMDAYRRAGGPDVPQRQIDFFALRAGLRLMNLVLHGGRDSFDKGLSNDVLVASAGAHFTQRLLHRVAGILDDVLARTAAG